jgi:hypothetical protein
VVGQPAIFPLKDGEHPPAAFPRYAGKQRKIASKTMTLREIHR